RIGVPAPIQDGEHIRRAERRKGPGGGVPGIPNGKHHQRRDKRTESGHSRLRDTDGDRADEAQRPLPKFEIGHHWVLNVAWAPSSNLCISVRDHTSYYSCGERNGFRRAGLQHATVPQGIKTGLTFTATASERNKKEE